MKNNGGNIYLGDDSTNRTTGCGKVKLLLKDGRIRTLLKVLDVPYLARNLIYIRKLSDAGVQIMFEKETCKMVQGSMVLMRGVWCGTLYNMLGSTTSDGCNSSIFPRGENEKDRVSIAFRENTML